MQYINKYKNLKIKSIKRGIVNEFYDSSFIYYNQKIISSWGVEKFQN